MAAFTYGALLQALGLSNLQFMGIALLVLVLWSIIYFFYKLGAISPVKFEKNKLPKFKALYISF